jgi:hypothetical protein
MEISKCPQNRHFVIFTNISARSHHIWLLSLRKNFFSLKFFLLLLFIQIAVLLLTCVAFEVLQTFWEEKKVLIYFPCSRRVHINLVVVVVVDSFLVRENKKVFCLMRANDVFFKVFTNNYFALKCGH